MTTYDENGYRVGPCDLCGVDHDDALSCDEAAAEYAAEKRAGVA